MSLCPGRDRLELFLAERLDDRSREELEQHVESCRACQEVLDALSEGADWGPLHRPAAAAGAAAETEGFLRRLQESPPGAIEPLATRRDHQGEAEGEGEGGSAPVPAQAATGSLERPPTGRALAARPAAHPERLGDYDIRRVIGEGGMGVVYEAEHESLRTRVALKVMHPRFRTDPTYMRRFRTEARSAARLHHTNIVPVFDYGDHDGICYYAMPLITGVGLDQVLQDVRRIRATDTEEAHAGGKGQDEGAATGRADPAVRAVTQGLMTGRFAVSPATPSVTEPPSTATVEDAPRDSADGDRLAAAARGVVAVPSGPDSGTVSHSMAGQPETAYYKEVARLVSQVADALDYAHHEGVVHRDIKPSNLMLDARGNVWVTDFGLAKLTQGDDLSQSHDLVGTLRFMAPERFRGVTDRRVDIYALGATLYEMLTLRPAFAERDQIRLIDQITHQTPTPLREHDGRIPRDLETIVLKTLSKDPKDRCDKAGELRDELRRFLEGRPTRWRRVGVLEQFRRWCRRNPSLAAANIAAAALTTLLAIGATIAAWTYRDQRNEIGNNLIEIKASVREARQAQTEAREELFKALLDRARAGRFTHQVGQRFKSLEALHQAADIGRDLELPRERFEPLRNEAIACMALPDLEPTGPVVARPPNVIAWAFDSTMTRYAFRFRDGTISIRRFADDQEIARFQARGDRDIYLFGFSPDGRYLATIHRPDGALTVWDIDRRAVALDDHGPVALFEGIAKFSPDSQRIAVTHVSGGLFVYQLATGQPSWRSPVPRPGALAFHPDGTQIAVVYSDQSNRLCRVLQADTGRPVRSIPLLTSLDIWDLAWSPDGATLATGCDDMVDDKVYLWDATTGVRTASLEGDAHINGGGFLSPFHPSGTLLAINHSELQLWDPVLGRQRLSASGAFAGFSQDGRMVVHVEKNWTTYHVDPALEYRTFAHVASQRVDCRYPSIRHDGRVLSVASIDGGVVLWDLARGTELAFLPIGDVWSATFEAAGDLLTSGSTGVRRWPIQLDLGHGIFRIGPPRQLLLPPGVCESAEDRSGRVVARAGHAYAFIATAEKTTPIGPLDDCRSISVSPGGEWLATGTHVASHGAQVWRVRDATKVADLPIDYGTSVVFSPDGKWLMTREPPCRLWEVGTWREAKQKIDGQGWCFSPDGRQLVVQDASKVIRLVETETGRTLARLESPDLYAVNIATFSPDGARLVVTTQDGPAVHVWDLRAIRRQLARIGLDWDSPAYSNDDPADASLPPLPALQVDLGPSPQTWAPEPKFYESFITHLEAMLARQPDERRIRGALAYRCNEYAWALATGPESIRDHQRSLALARRAVELAPNAATLLNTLGVAQYRAGQLTEAIGTLERSLAATEARFAGVDLFFLAMAHRRLGHWEEAKRCFERAVHWLKDQKDLSAQQSQDLAAFRAEAEAVLGLTRPVGELPADVFASEPSDQP
jgi:serine/threonine protein kinase/WD40 repeat protein